MELNVISYNYEPTTSTHFQGTKKELSKKLDEGYQVARGGKGSYVLSKPSIAQLVANVNGEVQCFDAKEAIKEAYGKERVTEKSLQTLIDDVKSGSKKVFYSSEEGLKIK